MAEVLSQSEVEALLAALAPDISAVAGKQSAAVSIDPTQQIAAVDFRRPQHVRDELIQLCRPMTERFARRLSEKLTQTLRANFQAKLISVDQLAFGEFISNVDNPSLIAQLESEGLGSSIVLDMNPSICIPMVDRLMGGIGTPINNVPRRPLSDIERTVIKRVTSTVFQELEAAWKQLCDLRLGPADFETLPDAVHCILPSEAVITFNMEWIVGDARGLATLCVPDDSLKPFLAKLSTNNRSDYNTVRLLDEPNPIEQTLERTKVEVSAHLAQTRLTAEDLVSLEVGDIIQTDCQVQSTMKLLVEGRAMFDASPGVVEGHKAAQIKQRLNESVNELLPSS